MYSSETWIVYRDRKKGPPRACNNEMRFLTGTRDFLSRSSSSVWSPSARLVTGVVTEFDRSPGETLFKEVSSLRCGLRISGEAGLPIRSCVSPGWGQAGNTHNSTRTEVDGDYASLVRPPARMRLSVAVPGPSRFGC